MAVITPAGHGLVSPQTTRKILASAHLSKLTARCYGLPHINRYIRKRLFVSSPTGNRLVIFQCARVMGSSGDLRKLTYRWRRFAIVILPPTFYGSVPNYRTVVVAACGNGLKIIAVTIIARELGWTNIAVGSGPTTRTRGVCFAMNPDEAVNAVAGIGGNTIHTDPAI